MQPTPLTPYDEMPYPAGAYQQSHPDRLETLARLFGMTPPDIRHSRILELGCADGANLMPMACALPESTFVGVDLSARQIKSGQENIAALHLKNIELRHADIRDVDETFGVFDYVIVHGVYSWVPTEVQERILSICNQRLAENGVAYVSYNTYPGWRMRGMLRDMMLYHARKFDHPPKQIEQARALINWLSNTIKAESGPYGMLLQRELEQMSKWQDTYLRHDSLAEINEPVYFHQFIGRAERHGLQYLAEAEFHTMLASNYAAPIDETLNRVGRDIIEMEQYMDFLRNRVFRQTLLCHRAIKLNRALGPWSLTGLHVAATLQSTNADLHYGSGHVESFRSQSGLTLSTSGSIVKAAFVGLAEHWPQAILFPELLTKARALQTAKGIDAGPHPDIEAVTETLGSALLTAFAKGLCELHSHPLPFALTAGELPSGCPLARWRAVHGNAVINRRHECVLLDSFERHLLPMLDGTRDRATLLEKLIALIKSGTLTVKVDDKPLGDGADLRQIMCGELEKRLRRFGRSALLTG